MKPAFGMAVLLVASLLAACADSTPAQDASAVAPGSITARLNGRAAYFFGTASSR